MTIADVRRRLRDGRPTHAELRAWLGASDPAIAHAGALQLAARWREASETPDELAAIVPEVTGLAAETQIMLAGLAAVGLPIAAPAARAALPPLVEVAWLRVALVRGDAPLDAIVGTAAGRDALAELPTEAVIVGGLLARLVTSEVEVARRAAVRYIRDGLQRGLVAPADAQRWLLAIIASSVAATAIAALVLLAEPWASDLPLLVIPPLGPAARTFDAERAQLETLRRRRALPILRRALTTIDSGDGDDGRDRDARRVLLEICARGLGELGDARDLAALVDLVARRPEDLAIAVSAALVALKRRGHGPDDDQARRLFALYLDTPRLAAATVAEILASRAEIVVGAVEAAIHDDPDGDPDWARTVALLEALGTARAIARLLAMLARTDERPGWACALRALGRLAPEGVEAAILARLHDEPGAALAALARVGGDATVTALRAALALADPAAPRPPWATIAAPILFALDPSVATFEALAAAALIDRRTLAALPAHGPLPAAPALRAMIATVGHPLRIDALQSLGRSGHPRALALLALALTDPDDDVRAAAIAGLRTLGARLDELDAPRPIEISTSRDPATAAVATAALDRLRDPTLDADAIARLLDAVAGLDHPQLIARVRPFLRDRDPELRKRAVAALVGAGAPAVAWIGPHLTDDDLVVVRQAVIALGAIGRAAAGWAPALARLLEQPNMNVKKAAAEALARAGDPAVAPALIAWLGHHDNPGLRALLITALRAILGPWTRAAMIASLAEADDDRRRGLLLDALAGTLGPGDLAGLARAHRAPWTALLVRRAYAGQHALATGAPIDLDAELRRRGCAGDLAASEPRDGDDATTTAGLDALARARARARLGRALRGDRGEVGDLLAQVGAMPLSVDDGHALIDRWAELDLAARAAGRALLAPLATRDALLDARLIDLALAAPREELPPALAALTAPRWSLDLARWWLHAGDAATRAKAARITRLAPDPTATATSPAALAIALDRIAAGDLDGARAICPDSAHAAALIAAIARLHGLDAALACAVRWRAEAPLHADALHAALVELGAPAIPALRRLAHAGDVELRARVWLLGVIAAADGDGAEARAFLADTVTAGPRALAPAAVHALLPDARLPERRRLLDRFLDGDFGDALSVPLGAADAPWLAAALTNATGPRRMRALGLLAQLDDDRRDALALATWRQAADDPHARAAAAHLLRAAPVAQVWPLIAPALADGDWTVLDVLGATAIVPPALIAQIAAHPERIAAWGRYLDRATSGALVAPQLAAAIVDGLAGAGAGDLDHALRVMARLVDWADPAGAAALAAAIAPVLAGPERARAVATVLAAIAARDPAARLALLVPIARPDDPALVLAIADAILAAPTAAAALPIALAAAVERTLADQLTGRDAERIRAILSARVRAARTDAEHAALLDTLDAAIAHPHARVRLHAHRLLRQLGARDRYVRASRALLDDPDPAIVRSAIRVVAFARDHDAGEVIAALLDHAHAAVRAAARAGLLVLGDEARPALSRALAHARPDRRAPIAALIADLDRAADEPDGADDADDA
jgi:hypothetical protein